MKNISDRIGANTCSLEPFWNSKLLVNLRKSTVTNAKTEMYMEFNQPKEVQHNRKNSTVQRNNKQQNNTL